jgi:pimeloyl-ACP methyl ester carboxylesterase
VSLRKGYADTPDGQVHYRERPGDGTPIVLLHQTASSSVMWERVMRCYPPGRRLLALDTPGFGLSDPPPACPPEGLAYYARRVAGALDALAIERAAFAGHHTGAMIAAELAAGAPARVERLVLLGLVVLDDPAEGRAFLDSLTHWQPDARGDFVADTLLPRMHLSVTRDDGEHMRMELAAYLQAGPDYWWAYDAVFTYDAPARLPLIVAPTLCAVGADEPEELLEWVRRGAALIPGARHLEIGDAGVELVIQDPELVAGVLQEFVGG